MSYETFIYKYLGITRKRPCGRSKSDSYLCCMKIPNNENSYVVNDGNRHVIICKVCGCVHVSSSTALDSDVKKAWSDNF